MTDIQILKRYKYRGLNIAIRLLGGDVIEYLFAYKGSIYTQSYDRHTHKHQLKEIGAATIIVCSAAEKVVDIVLERKSLYYKLKKRLGFKVEAENQNKKDGNQKESVSAGPRPDSRHEGPSETSEPNREVGSSGAPSENQTPSGKDGVPK